MVFINHRCRQAMNEPLFTVFFVATIVYNPVLFKNVEKVFLFDIMTHNRRIMLLTRSCNICYLLRNLDLFSTGILRNSFTKNSGNGNCRCQCFFSYILRLVCRFNVIFFVVLSNNKRKLPANN